MINKLVHTSNQKEGSSINVMKLPTSTFAIKGIMTLSLMHDKGFSELKMVQNLKQTEIAII